MGLLNDKEIEKICKAIGINDVESVSNTSNWCYFPANDGLTQWIHYEIIKRAKGIQYEFHIECDAPELIKILNNLNNKGVKRSKSNKKYIYCPSGRNQSHENSIKNLYKHIDPYIKSFLNSHQNYNTLNQDVEVQHNQLSQLTHYNFFQGFSNGNHGPSENDHTRILMSILKFCDGNMRVLESFFDKFGINENAQQVTSNDIFINKGYNSGNDIIDGLILRKKNGINDFAVIIENKICGATDQKGQINRYVKAIQDVEQIIQSRIYVIYLTQDGLVNQGKPSVESCSSNVARGLGDRLICINYRYDILPWLKNTVYSRMKFSSIGWAIDNYIDYLENLFGEDSISKMVNANIKSHVLTKLNLTGMSDEEQARALDSVLKELQLFTKYDSLKNVLNSYFKELTAPLMEQFCMATKSYFKQQGKGVVVNDRLNSGYIQVLGEQWNRSVHYEWCKLNAVDFFFGTKPLELTIHIEGSNLKQEKNRFFVKYPHMKLPLKCDLNGSSLADYISKGRLDSWLGNAYNQVLSYWNDLEAIH